MKSTTRTGTAHAGGRVSAYSGPAVKKSFTLDGSVVRRLESRSSGNLSLTANRLLEQAMDHEEELERIRDLAELIGIEVDPAIEARAMRYLLEVAERADATVTPTAT